MGKFITYISNDLKIIFRDKTMIIMFFLPLIFIFLCRLGLPIISRYVPQIIEYYWIIIASFCILSGAMPAFLTAFLMLDEKDENITEVLKIIPFPYTKLITYRIIFLMFSSYVFSNIFLFFNGLFFYPIHKIIMVSILVSFVPALLTLGIIPFAKNKIEGVTLFKGFNSLLFIPIIAFFVPENWQYVFGIVPFFWAFDLLSGNIPNHEIVVRFIVGLLVNISYLLILTHFFIKRTTIMSNQK